MEMNEKITDPKLEFKQLISYIRPMANINFKDTFKYEDLSILKDLFGFGYQLDISKIFENMKNFIILDRLRKIDEITLWVDYLILNKTIEQFNFSEINAMTILALIRHKEEPNYNVLPKLYSNGKFKYHKLADLVFGESIGAVKTVNLIEYFRQWSMDIEVVILQMIKVKIIDCWFKIYEPKTIEWYIDFLRIPDEEEFNFKNEIEKILNLLDA